MGSSSAPPNNTRGTTIHNREREREREGVKRVKAGFRDGRQGTGSAVFGRVFRISKMKRPGKFAAVGSGTISYSGSRPFLAPTPQSSPHPPANYVRRALRRRRRYQPAKLSRASGRVVDTILSKTGVATVSAGCYSDTDKPDCVPRSAPSPPPPPAPGWYFYHCDLLRPAPPPPPARSTTSRRREVSNNFPPAGGFTTTSRADNYQAAFRRLYSRILQASLQNRLVDRNVLIAAPHSAQVSACSFGRVSSRL